MSTPFGIEAIHPVDNQPHVLAVADARAASENLLEFWNGPTNAARVLVVRGDGDIEPETDSDIELGTSSKMFLGLYSDVVYAGDGAVGTPGFTFASTPNAGMYLSGSNEIALATAGAQRLTLSAGGVVYTGNAAGSTGASAGDIVMQNQRWLRDDSGGASRPIIRRDSGGIINFGTARAAAGTPGNFSADFYIEFEDVNGAKFFVPAMNASW